MTDNVNISQITTLQELHKMQEVEKSVWNMPPIPVHQTFTALNNGGIILGAFIDQQMVGFLYSFAGFDSKHPYLCSHMLGILPKYRKDGLGVKMKFKQAEIAQRMGYPMITWTFDPLESLNAYLNLHKIGAVGAYYKADHYGSMDDGLNKGLPTDRIQIEWRFNEKRSLHKSRFDESRVLLTVDRDGYPTVTDAFTGEFDVKRDGWFVAIPEHFQAMKEEKLKLAGMWRHETRKVFQALFSNGYQAVDVLRDCSNELSYYYFSN